jgi:hypothetical protein
MSLCVDGAEWETGFVLLEGDSLELELSARIAELL